MFLSYEHNYRYEAGKHQYVYTITDTDFTETVSTNEACPNNNPAEIAIIKTYEKRGLPVAANLLRYIIRSPNIDAKIRTNRKHNPYWHKYEDDVRKLLLLI